MTINAFAKLVCQKEAKKEQVNIAQVLEILAVMQRIIKRNGIDLYAIIRAL